MENSDHGCFDVEAYDFLTQRLRHKQVEDQRLQPLLNNWVYLCDDSSDTYGIVKFVQTNNCFYQLLICNDYTDGLYLIDTMYLRKRYDEKKEKDIFSVYPLYLDLKLQIDRTNIKQEFKAWEKLKKLGIISENEQKFLQILKNTSIKDNAFTHGMLEINTFLEKATLKMILKNRNRSD